MIRTILSIIFFSFFIYQSSFAQENYNRIDTNGWKQGKWIKMWSNGEIKYKGQFHDDQPYGEFRYYYPSGKLKAIMTFQEDGKKAHNITYHENGEKMAEGDFIQQKKEGIWKYYGEDGKLIYEETYHNGTLNGKKITYYPESGQPFEVLEYKNGIKNGKWIKYFPEGTMMTQTQYINGKLEGDFVNYTPEGKILVKGKYKNDKQDGVWEFYDEATGKLLRKEHYRAGKLIKTEQSNDQ